MRRYHYRWGEGMWSYVLHRVSGLALALYLMMHVWVIHHVTHGGSEYDALMKKLHSPLFRLGEAALLAAILYHGINGMRLMLMDAGVGLKSYRKSFWIVFAVCAILGITGAAVLVFM